MLLAGDWRVWGAFSKLHAIYNKWAWLGWPVTGRQQGAFSTLLRRPGLWTSTGGVMAT